MRTIECVTFDDARLQHLKTLARQVPGIEAAVARIAELKARMSLPKGTVHVFSDVHGEYIKMRHVINNASGRLRPVVDKLFLGRLDEAERRQLLNLIYYPWEQLEQIGEGLVEPGAQGAFVKRVVGQQVELLREMARAYPLDEVQSTFPEAWRQVLTELLVAPVFKRPDAYSEAILDAIIEEGQGLEFLRRISRAIRNLAVDEIIVAGDMGDRGPRIDKVLAYLMRQPDVSIIWGNHDVLWMGACLGQAALIATVVRVSLRYGRVSQLEEGYGIPLLPLQSLALKLYGDDPCERFAPKVKNLEDPLMVSRMQKAIAIIQFKLEGELIREHPEWGMEARNLLHHIDLDAGTVEIDGVSVPMADTFLPTLDPADPYALSEDERVCIEKLRGSFLHSPILWQQMSYMFRKGAMYTARDDHLIYHGAMPVGDEGQRLSMVVEGAPVSGKGLFDACQTLIHRAFRQGDKAAVDFHWVLWAGPVSPLFGKDRMATFESYFLADKALSKETKNPYFKLINDADFVRGILREFGVNPERGLLVNGHVPVKIEKGESPVKEGGNAVTIDGAFAAAYGDKGYTLILEADRSCLAQHHSFHAVSDSIERGADIIPTISDLRTFNPPHQVADTEEGAEIRLEISALEDLIVAYRENLIQERD